MRQIFALTNIILCPNLHIDMAAATSTIFEMMHSMEKYELIMNHYKAAKNTKETLQNTKGLNFYSSTVDCMSSQYMATHNPRQVHRFDDSLDQVVPS